MTKLLVLALILTIPAIEALSIARSISRLSSRFFKTITPEYEDINRWLMEHTAEALGARGQVQAAHGYLQAHMSHFTDLNDDGARLAAWGRFTDLLQIGAIGQCNQATNEILNKNSIDSGVAHWLKSSDSTRPALRVQKIVYDIMVRHSRECARVYSHEFESIYRYFDPNRAKVIDDLTRNFAFEFRASESNFIPNDVEQDKFYAKVNRCGKTTAASVVSNVIEKNFEFMNNYQPGFVTYNRGNLTRMLATLSSACQAYIETVRDLFKSASFDAEASDVNSQEYGSHLLSKGWVQYQVCTNFNSRNLEKLLDALISRLSGHEHYL